VVQLETDVRMGLSSPEAGAVVVSACRVNRRGVPIEAIVMAVIIVVNGVLGYVQESAE
jgi:hypothetical protein